MKQIILALIALALGACSTFDRTAFEWDPVEQGWLYKHDRTVECIVMDNTGEKPYCMDFMRTQSFRPTYNELRPY